MSYECADHGYYGFEPCAICLREMDVRKIEAQAPQTVIKHVHDPGPCPECARRTDRDVTQRWTFLLALLLGLLGWFLASFAPGWLQGPWKAVPFVPAGVVAFIGVFLGIPKAHREQP